MKVSILLIQKTQFLPEAPNVHFAKTKCEQGVKNLILFASPGYIHVELTISSIFMDKTPHSERLHEVGPVMQQSAVVSLANIFTRTSIVIQIYPLCQIAFSSMTREKACSK